MNYLHPGTVAGPDIDKNFVIIQLDDGDIRDIHVDQVRYLPEDYPFVGKMKNDNRETHSPRRKHINLGLKYVRFFFRFVPNPILRCLTLTFLIFLTLFQMVIPLFNPLKEF